MPGLPAFPAPTRRWLGGTTERRDRSGGRLEEIREDVRRYAEAGLTELFLEANFDPTGRTALRLIEVIEALAPESLTRLETNIPVSCLPRIVGKVQARLAVAHARTTPTPSRSAEAASDTAKVSDYPDRW
jgi:hypothetical protein